jgi:hypothetical protein
MGCHTDRAHGRIHCLNYPQSLRLVSRGVSRTAQVATDGIGPHLVAVRVCSHVVVETQPAGLPSCDRKVASELCRPATQCGQRGGAGDATTTPIQRDVVTDDRKDRNSEAESSCSSSALSLSLSVASTR